MKPIPQLSLGPKVEYDQAGAAYAEKAKRLADAKAELKTIEPLSGDRFVRRRDELEKEIERLTDEIRKLREQGGKAQQSSFLGLGDGPASLIQKASFGAGRGFGRGLGGGGDFTG